MLGARARGFTTIIGLPGDPVFELRLERSGTPDESRSRPALAALLEPPQRACRCPSPSSLELTTEDVDVEVIGPEGMRELGAALGRLDRVRFLSARLREDMIGELRFSAARRTPRHDGIEVASLDLDPSDRAAMDVLRLGAGMDFLASIDRGWGLGNLARDTFTGSGGALVLRAPATDHAALVLAGRGLMRIWLDATRRGLAVHAWGSPFLFQHLLEGVARSLGARGRPGRRRPLPRRRRSRAPDPADPAHLALRPAVRALAAPPAGRRPVLTLEDFQPHVGEQFGPLELTLARSDGEPPAPGLRAPFTLEFRGPEGLPQQIHQLEHPTLGTVEIFLVPVAPGTYEAIFAVETAYLQKCAGMLVSWLTGTRPAPISSTPNSRAWWRRRCRRWRPRAGC